MRSSAALANTRPRHPDARRTEHPGNARRRDAEIFAHYSRNYSNARVARRQRLEELLHELGRPLAGRGGVGLGETDSRGSATRHLGESLLKGPERTRRGARKGGAGLRRPKSALIPARSDLRLRAGSRRRHGALRRCCDTGPLRSRGPLWLPRAEGPQPKDRCRYHKPARRRGLQALQGARQAGGLGC